LPDPVSADATRPRPSVFLSYASEDRAAARALRDVMQPLGLEIWYDESELGGGEAWDQKIRRQIRECDYFMPVISATTEARHEGYFRREWRLAVERTLDMADDHLFLLPIVIDGTDQAVARVPEKFLSVQWLKVPGGQPTAALEALCQRIAAGATATPAPARKARDRRDPAPPGTQSSSAESAATATSTAPPVPGAIPAFPRQEPGQRLRFWVEVAAWVAQRAWIQFKRLPRWLRIVAYVWVAIAVVSRCDSSKEEASHDLTPAKVEKLKDIAQNYKGSTNKSDIVKLGLLIAKEIGDESDAPATARSPLLAIPFTAPTGNAAAAKVADSSFAMTYGMLARSHQGQIGLTEDALPKLDLSGALERARANHSQYVLFGAVGGGKDAAALTVQIAQVSDGAVVWSKAFPIANADPQKIAAEVDARLPPLAAKSPSPPMPTAPSTPISPQAGPADSK
jgi:hypothetical protein